MTLTDFLAKLKDTNLESEVEFKISLLDCPGHDSGEYCYCQYVERTLDIETVLFQRDADAAAVVKTVIQLTQ